MPTKNVDACFQDLARAHPEKIAVECDSERVTYQQLAQRAARFAAALSARRAPAEALCGLCLPPSIDAVAAVLGVLQAGAAFVPLDPDSPPERLSSLIKEARLQYLICPKEKQSSLPAQLQKIHPEELPHTQPAASSPLTQEAAREDGERLAYVIYTSGSTGAPKGAMIEHHSLRDLIDAERVAFDLRPTDRVLQFASLSFDVSVYEIFTTLTAGATLCIPTREARRPGPALLRFLQDEAITFATLLPPVLASLPNRDLPRLRVIVTGGEPCPQHIVDDWARGRRFFNAYGPTEATIGATFYECAPHQEVCIGKALPHASMYVLDEALRPVQPGEKGELYIGGTGVGRGYLFDAAKTQERFLANPFGAGRLYKTGDLGRLRPDGNLVFLGRLDDQIKHHGFRIELGEIEHALLQNERVQEAAVVFEQELIAFYLGVVSAVELARFLEERLPRYMIPRRFILVERPPLTPHGKWDKTALRALAATERAERATPTQHPAARNSTETKIAALFAEVLSLPSFAATDDFFARGGDSLLAAKLLFRLQEELQDETRLTAFFEEPTPRHLAAAMRRDSRAEIRAEVAALAAKTPALPEVAPRPHVILTGATGYLGGYLLRELLQRGEEVVCLVRGQDLAEAERRLHQKITEHQLEACLERVQVARYDLAAPTELPAALRYPKRLYHCAANVDLLRPYATLRRENLYGVASLLSLCARQTQLHYVSTLSASERTGGYAQSKWAAELLIKSAQLQWSITRPALISGHSTERSLNPHDFFYALLTESLRQGQLPHMEALFELVFVDEVARQLCEAAPGERTLRSACPVSMRDIAAALTQQGAPVSLAPYSRWRAAAQGAGIGRHLAYLDALSQQGDACPAAPSDLHGVSSREVLLKYLEVFLTGDTDH